MTDAESFSTFGTDEFEKGLYAEVLAQQTTSEGITEIEFWDAIREMKEALLEFGRQTIQVESLEDSWKFASQQAREARARSAPNPEVNFWCERQDWASDELDKVDHLRDASLQKFRSALGKLRNPPNTRAQD